MTVDRAVAVRPKGRDVYMYKNLNAESLGFRGRQNELIELTLTYKFRGFDIDIEDVATQIEVRGRDHATRFLQSANVSIGSFDLPVDLAAADDVYQEQLSRLEQRAEIAASLWAHRCIANLTPYCEGRAYHENFELHRERISQVARPLATHDIHLGLGFLAPKHLRELGDSQFIAAPDALLTLIQTVADDNLGLCLDSWHWHVAGGNLEQLKGFPVQKIVMVRVADLPVDANLDEVTEEQRMLPGATGVVPNREWLTWLSEQEYAGPITPFCHPAEFDGRTRTKAVEKASEALVRLMQGNDGGDDGDGGDVDAANAPAATADA